MFLHADKEDSDQTGRKPMLIWVFAGRTDHSVGFVMLLYRVKKKDKQWSGTDKIRTHKSLMSLKTELWNEENSQEILKQQIRSVMFWNPWK